MLIRVVSGLVRISVSLLGLISWLNNKFEFVTGEVFVLTEGEKFGVRVKLCCNNITYCRVLVQICDPPCGDSVTSRCRSFSI